MDSFPVTKVIRRCSFAVLLLHWNRKLDTCPTWFSTTHRFNLNYFCLFQWSKMASNDQLSYLKSHHSNRHQKNHNSNLKLLRNQLVSSLRFSSVASSLLLVLLATLIPLSLASSTCTKHEYWNMDSDQCVLCAKCSQHEIVMRPCQRHMDTLCKPLNSVEIDWSKSMATDKSLSHHHQHQPSVESFSAQTSTLSEDELIWDWQMVSLVLAVAACLMFFIGTALISINYIRQWRKIKKQFDNGEFSVDKSQSEEISMNLNREWFSQVF